MKPLTKFETWYGRDEPPPGPGVEPTLGRRAGRDPKGRAVHESRHPPLLSPVVPGTLARAVAFYPPDDWLIVAFNPSISACFSLADNLAFGCLNT